MDKLKNRDVVHLPILDNRHIFTPCIGFVLVITLFLSGCAGNIQTSTPRYNEPTPKTQAEESEWNQAQLPSTLNGALNQANPFVYNNRSIPAELAIHIIKLSNLQSDWQSVGPTHSHINPQAMSTEQFAHYSAEITSAWRSMGEHENISDWLNSDLFMQRFPLMDISKQIAFTQVRADIYADNSKPLESARERIFIHDFIEDDDERLKNLQAILENVLSIKKPALHKNIETTDDKQLRGWLEFSLVSGNIQQSMAIQETATQEWKRRWKHHPANHFISPIKKTRPSLLNTASFTSTSQKIGVFLPLSGKLAIAGKALRDGILSAYYDSINTLTEGIAAEENETSLPPIQFYDTTNVDIEQLYAQASADGVTAIIGPLQKSNVQALFTMPTKLPILTLNFISEELPPPNNIVQFGLATEDEAKQIAQYAYSNNFRKPLVLVSDKDWSQRAARVFNDTWRDYRETDAVIQPLTASAQFSADVASGLGLPISEKRHSVLKNMLGTTLEYKPRRRQDVDFIVLFTNSKDAKTINPLLDYHYAADLPVFASSHVFNANNDVHQVDLDGIIFSEIPWLINKKDTATARAQLEDHLLKSKTQQRLYAMGQDAFHLYSRIDQLKLSPTAQWLANTGKLSIRDQRVVRELPLAQFQRNGVVALQY